MAENLNIKTVPVPKEKPEEFRYVFHNESSKNIFVLDTKYLDNVSPVFNSYLDKYVSIPLFKYTVVCHNCDFGYPLIFISNLFSKINNFINTKHLLNCRDFNLILGLPIKTIYTKEIPILDPDGNKKSEVYDCTDVYIGIYLNE